MLTDASLGYVRRRAASPHSHRHVLLILCQSQMTACKFAHYAAPPCMDFNKTTVVSITG